MRSVGRCVTLASRQPFATGYGCCAETIGCTGVHQWQGYVRANQEETRTSTSSRLFRSLVIYKKQQSEFINKNLPLVLFSHFYQTLSLSLIPHLVFTWEKSLTLKSVNILDWNSFTSSALESFVTLFFSGLCVLWR